MKMRKLKRSLKSNRSVKRILLMSLKNQSKNLNKNLTIVVIRILFLRTNKRYQNQLVLNKLTHRLQSLKWSRLRINAHNLKASQRSVNLVSSSFQITIKIIAKLIWQKIVLERYKSFNCLWRVPSQNSTLQLNKIVEKSTALSMYLMTLKREFSITKHS